MISSAAGEFITRLCRERAGLRIDAEKTYLIDSRLGPLARREGYGTVAEFLERLRGVTDDDLLWAVIEAMTPAETTFFRDAEVFSRMESEILPRLITGAGGRKIRVWCAGCATGQEAYSLAMILAEAPEIGRYVELFASDISRRSLEKAQAGLYSQFEIQRGLPARRLVRHFENQGDLFAISPRITAEVRWRRINLLDDLTPFGQFDLILSRYVLSGMDEAPRAQVLAALERSLAPGGAIVLGRTESAPGMAGSGAGVFTMGSASRSAA